MLSCSAPLASDAVFLRHQGVHHLLEAGDYADNPQEVVEVPLPDQVVSLGTVTEDDAPGDELQLLTTPSASDAGAGSPPGHRKNISSGVKSLAAVLATPLVQVKRTLRYTHAAERAFVFCSLFISDVRFSSVRSATENATVVVKGRLDATQARSKVPSCRSLFAECSCVRNQTP